MKVCHITSVHPYLDNRIFFKQCLSLSKRGHQVVLLAPDCRISEEKTIRLVRLYGPKKRLLRMLITSFFSTLYLSLKEKAQIYHIHDPELIPLGIILRILGKNVIYDVHENYAGEIKTKPYLRPNILRNVLSITVDKIEKFCSKYFSAIILARPDLQDLFPHRKVFLVRNFPKIDIISHFIPSPMIAPKISSKKSLLRVIYVGAMTEIRGIYQLVQAMEYLDNTHLTLVGHFHEKELFEKCRTHPAWSKVTYVGKVLPEKIYDYICAAHIGVIPFLPSPNHLTTMATKPFEYMLGGLPLVMSDFPYWRELFGESALYFAPYSPIDLARAIKEMAKDPVKAKQIGEMNRQKVLQEFNWHSEEKALFRCYEEVCASIIV